MVWPFNNSENGELSQPHSSLGQTDGVWMCVLGERACAGWWNQAWWEQLSTDAEFGILTAFLVSPDEWGSFKHFAPADPLLTQYPPLVWPKVSPPVSQIYSLAACCAQTPLTSSQTSQAKKGVLLSKYTWSTGDRPSWQILKSFSFVHLIEYLWIVWFCGWRMFFQHEEI